MEDDAFCQTVVTELSCTDPSRLLSPRASQMGHMVPSTILSDAYAPSQTHQTDGGLVDLKLHPSGIVPILQNVVVTCSLGCALDLKKIAQQARNAEYNPKRFAAVIIRIREPKTTALIFTSGKMVCTGAKNEKDSRLAARKYAKIVMKLGYNVTFHDFKIQNIVGSCDVQFNIGLEGLNIKHSLFTRYEPELFPGLIYKMKSPKVVLLIFVSGKVVITGAKLRSEIYQAFENIYPAVKEFRKGRAPIPRLLSKEVKPASIHSSNPNPQASLSEERKPDVSRLSYSLSSRSASIQEDSQSVPNCSSDTSSIQASIGGDVGMGSFRPTPSTPHISTYQSPAPTVHFISSPPTQV